MSSMLRAANRSSTCGCKSCGGCGAYTGTGGNCCANLICILASVDGLGSDGPDGPTPSGSGDGVLRSSVRLRTAFLPSLLGGGGCSRAGGRGGGGGDGACISLLMTKIIVSDL